MGYVGVKKLELAREFHWIKGFIFLKPSILEEYSEKTRF